MPYITREDGEHFVIPSYRDVLIVSSKSQLKKDILALSRNYGAYIAMQAKGARQYEIALSPDAGYLLGESIWHHFNRPMDLIYCEAIPNEDEAILVIVKSGVVYLDGRFPLETIPEELIIFLTQQNNFEIYLYGDVPISETQETAKFNFDPSSVKSFVRLDKPVFSTLPLLKAYQLQLVEPALRARGIGVFPARSVMTLFVIVIGGWLLWIYLSQPEEVVLKQPVQIDVYQGFYTALMTPAPDQEIAQLIAKLYILNSMPGWSVASLSYKANVLSVLVLPGGSLEALLAWAEKNEASVDIKSDGVFVNMSLTVDNRPKPTAIYPIKQITSSFIDRIAQVYPGNHVQLGEVSSKGTYSVLPITITLEDMTPVVLSLIGKQLEDLPLNIIEITLTNNNGQLSGAISLEGLGNQYGR